MYHVILAATPQEANTYAQRAKLPRGRTRYVVRASSIRGLRLAKIHELPSYARRPDRHAIEAVLRYSKGERELVEMPEAPRPSLEDAYAELYRDIELTVFHALKAIEGQSDRVAEAIVAERLEFARLESTLHEDAVHLALILEGHENLLPNREAPHGEEAGEAEPSEDPAPAPKVESPAAERKKRKPAPQAARQRKPIFNADGAEAEPVVLPAATPEFF